MYNIFVDHNHFINEIQIHHQSKHNHKTNLINHQTYNTNSNTTNNSNQNQLNINNQLIIFFSLNINNQKQKQNLLFQVTYHLFTQIKFIISHNCHIITQLIHKHHQNLSFNKHSFKNPLKKITKIQQQKKILFINHEINQNNISTHHPYKIDFVPYYQTKNNVPIHIKNIINNNNTCSTNTTQYKHKT